MLIVFGRKLGRRELLGEVRQFCPICRSEGPHGHSQLESAFHLYFISLGSGHVVMSEVRCRQCGLISPYEHEADPRPRRMNTADRTALEERLSRGIVTAGEREYLMSEPLLGIGHMIESRTQVARIDPWSSLGCWGTCLLPLAGVGVPALLNVTSARVLEMAARVGVVGGAIALLVFLIAKATERRRYVRRIVFPMLARSLGPLSPSIEEVHVAVQSLYRAYPNVADLIPAERLHETIVEHKQLHGLR